MPSTTLYIAMSLDGFIADKEGKVDFLKPFEDRDYGYQKFIENIGTIVMGRKTYEQAITLGHTFTQKTFVLTTKDLPKQENVEFHSGDIKSLLKKVNSKKNIWLMGGSNTIQQFMNENAVDSIYIAVIPTILGEGIPLFKDIQPRALRLKSSKQYKNGVIMLNYTRK